MTIVYDPTGILPSNLVTNEVHTPVTEPDIHTNQGPFFASGFSITGTLIAGGATVPLSLFADYVWSPMFSARSAEIGKEVYSYILLTDYTKYSTIHLTYHAVGGSSDEVLLSEILAAGDFDRTSFDNWTNFVGDMVTLSIPGGSFNIKNTGVVNMIATKLDVIADELRTPSSYIDFIMNSYIPLHQDVMGLQIQVSAWAASFTNNGGGTYGIGKTLIYTRPSRQHLPAKSYGSVLIRTAGGKVCVIGMMLPNILYLNNECYPYFYITDIYNYSNVIDRVNGRLVNWIYTGSISNTGNYHYTKSVLLNDDRIFGVFCTGNGLQVDAIFGAVASGDAITFTIGTNTSFPTPRYHFTLTVIANNKVLLTGGIITSTGNANSATYIGTVSGDSVTWVAATALPSNLYRHEACLLSDGRVLITGGSIINPPNETPINNTYIGTISGNTITWVASTALPDTLASHTSTLLTDGRVLIMGGQKVNSDNHQYVLNPEWSSNATYIGTISGNTITWVTSTTMPARLANHSCVLVDTNRVMFTGGTFIDGGYSDLIYFGKVTGNSITFTDSEVDYTSNGDNILNANRSPNGVWHLNSDAELNTISAVRKT